MKQFLIGFMLLNLSCPQSWAQGGTPMSTAEDIIKKLKLEPLADEGGYYRQTYVSDDPGLAASDFGIHSASNSVRHFGTAIYYLVTPKSFSALHRLKSDEIFHFYAGDAVEMIQIDESGNLTKFTIGSDVMKGQLPQVVVPKGTWQSTKLSNGGAWALMGTTMAPGYDVEDFELGDRNELIKTFPQLKNDIIRFSREQGEKAHE